MAVTFGGAGNQSSSSPSSRFTAARRNPTTCQILRDHHRYDDGVQAMKQRSEYLDLRRRFEPASATLVIVAESPPVSGMYFYNPAGKVTEPLFAAIMKHLGVRPGRSQRA